MGTRAATSRISVCLLALVVSLLALTLSEGARAAESNTYSNSAVNARLVSAETGVAPDAVSISLGLVLEYGDGWKGYWRTPGEVGLAPEIDWAGSSNLASAEILWPAPERFEAFGIENFGYSGEVVLPIRVMLEDRGEPLELRARVALLTCSNVCVPHTFNLALDLPNGTVIDRASANAIATFVSQVPAAPEESDIEINTVALDAKTSSLFVTAQSTQPFQTVDVFPEFGPLVTFGKPDIRLSRDRSELWARIPLNAWSDDHAGPLVTVTDTGRAVTASVVLSADIPAPPYARSASGSGPFQLVLIAAIAFLGGLILNVMPCVLPVLSIKLASVLKVSDQPRRVIRNGFLFSALGVLTFVWMLAVLVLVLKWIGVSVGWGIQFQNPIFVALMFIVVAAFAANLFGLFEIALPVGIQDRLGAGSDRAGYAADFGTGLLAAILATPCSAPFLGTAITFALAGNAVDVFVVFTALGVGLASPYVLIAARPAMIERLPRPGRWMLFVKMLLGVLLLATAAWLLFVLVGVAGWRAAVLVAASACVLILLAMTEWSSVSLRRILMAASLAIPLVGVGLLSSQQRSVASIGTTYWQAFIPQDIARHVAEGHTVFVDVTADWCLTCKANKTLVLDRGLISDRLGDEAVIAMQADWTRPDAEIARFLERHGRYGIPFNIVFGPEAPSGISLPEILTQTLVLDALDRASARSVARD
ncbi:protein-disulfide reductase DsbD family protein [Sulfitobacter mediterraneus]|uniref:protein-disulfide reductase DsbD family protein n=1 Tax=Sulfitobacter mediterraneus TaxID=83219 RepID=UPI000EA0A9C9|nr:protein-disulfide reductase DsbD domain-containing protein [Sulfitobacter mediterraneus]